MKTVLMAVAVVRSEDKILLRKMDPAKSPYKELWALFGEESTVRFSTGPSKQRIRSTMELQGSY